MRAQKVYEFRRGQDIKKSLHVGKTAIPFVDGETEIRLTKNIVRHPSYLGPVEYEVVADGELDKFEELSNEGKVGLMYAGFVFTYFKDESYEYFEHRHSPYTLPFDWLMDNPHTWVRIKN